MPLFTLTNDHFIKVYSYRQGDKEIPVGKSEKLIELTTEKDGKFYFSTDVLEHSLVSDKCSFLMAADVSWEELGKVCEALRLTALKNQVTIFSSQQRPKNKNALHSNAGDLVINSQQDVEYWKKFIEETYTDSVYIVGDETIVFDVDD